MSEGLKSYLANKIISLASVVTVIIGSLWYFGYVETQWQFVMIVLITMAYGHYIIGMVYQLKSFLRKEKPWQHFLTFGFLTLISLATAYLFFTINIIFALLLLLFYFLIHGLLNEQTLLFRQSGIHVSAMYVWPIFLIVIAILAYAVPDHTFLMSRNLHFLPDNEFLLQTSLNAAGISIPMFKSIFWISVAASLFMLFVAWLRSKQHIASLSIFLVLAVLVVLTHVFGALPYIYMLFLVVGYHFVTWFLFYFSTFKKRSKKQLVPFLIIHAALFIPFIIGGILFFGESTPTWSFAIFDYYFFTFATYLHITTSFMNDDWFKKLQEKAFNYFA